MKILTFVITIILAIIWALYDKDKKYRLNFEFLGFSILTIPISIWIWLILQNPSYIYKNILEICGNQ